MSWQIKDEWIDLGLGRHTVVFHNPEAMVFDAKLGKEVPAEHHLIHHFKRDACPTCGHVQHRNDADGKPMSHSEQVQSVDFIKLKAETLAGLEAHHLASRQYAERHGVRIGTGPKK
jgi:hypothetical protein